MNSFYSEKELSKIGFKSLGNNVLISRKVSIYNPEKISIDNNVRIDDFCIISGNINIGSYIHIAAFCALFGGKEINLHDFSGLSSRVVIYSTSDGYLGEGLTNPLIPLKFRFIYESIINIEKHSLVGTCSTILPGGSLGEGSVLGAMSLLRTKTGEWSVYAGVPAIKIKERQKETIYKLEREFLYNETSY